MNNMSVHRSTGPIRNDSIADDGSMTKLCGRHMVTIIQDHAAGKYMLKTALLLRNHNSRMTHLLDQTCLNMNRAAVKEGQHFRGIHTARIGFVTRIFVRNCKKFGPKHWLKKRILSKRG